MASTLTEPCGARRPPLGRWLSVALGVLAVNATVRALVLRHRDPGEAWVQAFTALAQVLLICFWFQQRKYEGLLAAKDAEIRRLRAMVGRIPGCAQGDVTVPAEPGAVPDTAG